MGRALDDLRIGLAVLLALGSLAGCAASRAAAPKEEPGGVSVHLPALEPVDLETRTQPPSVQPELTLPPPHPDDVEEGKARSLELMRIERGGGKPPKPAGTSPPEPEGKP